MLTVAVKKSSTGTVNLMDELDKMRKSSGVHLATMPSYLLIKVHIFQWEIPHGWSKLSITTGRHV